MIIVQASLDTGACDGVKTWAENVFSRGKIVKKEGLDVLDKRMNSLYPYLNKSYKFLGCEQGELLRKIHSVWESKQKMKKRMKKLSNKQIQERNLVQAVNTKETPVANYVMNACKFTRNNWMI